MSTSIKGLFPPLDEIETLNATDNTKYTNKAFNRIFKALNKHGVPDIKYMIKYSSLQGRLIDFHKTDKSPKIIEYLKIAFETNNTPWIKYLLPKFKVNKIRKIIINYLHISYLTPICVALEHCENITINKQIFKNLSDELCVFVIQNKLYKFNNPNKVLIFACKKGYVNLIKLMITLGADDFNGVIFYVCYYGYIELAKIMINSGNNINITNIHASLLIACRQGHLDIVKMMVESHVININNNIIITALKQAKIHRYIDIIYYLIELL